MAGSTGTRLKCPPKTGYPPGIELPRDVANPLVVLRS
jgi:hypothetical protein